MAMERWDVRVVMSTTRPRGGFENNIQGLEPPSRICPEDWVCPKCGAEKEFFDKAMG